MMRFFLLLVFLSSASAFAQSLNTPTTWNELLTYWTFNDDWGLYGAGLVIDCNAGDCEQWFVTCDGDDLGFSVFYDLGFDGGSRPPGLEPQEQALLDGLANLTDAELMCLPPLAGEVDCVPTDANGDTVPGMVACEQTLSDIRDALTNPAGLETQTAPDSSVSRSEAAFSTLTQQTTAKFNAADLPGKAADKFPFGYYELLASPQLSGTACELNSTGAGVGGLWRYCGSQYDTFLGGAIKTMMSGLVWISFALGVNARWAAAVT